MITPSNIDELQSCLRGSSRLLPVGGRTKPALSTPPRSDIETVNLKKISVIIEYEPSEYTFTALAGTALGEVEAMLADNGQYLPFDPPFIKAGATLGGTVAAGMNGPGSYRYGGIRDFILGIELIDGNGERLRAGGKVVKNAAGFDLPKFMIGSLGRFGVLTELTFKVFPKPPDELTFAIPTTGIMDALHLMTEIANGPWDLDALEIEPNEPPVLLVIRIRGNESALKERAERIGVSTGRSVELFDPQIASFYWNRRNAFSWADDDQSTLIKILCTPSNLASMEAALAEQGNVRIYSIGGNVAYVSGNLPRSLLDDEDTPALTLRGDQVFASTPSALMTRIKQTLDPRDRFPGLASSS